MSRYLRLVAIQLRVSAASAMAYRANFILEGAMTVVWVALTLLPLIVLFDGRDSVAGWDAPSALIVIAYFMAIRAVLEGIVRPSLVGLVDKIRSGSFDYVLLKPVDAQAMVTASTFEPWKLFDLLGAGAFPHSPDEDSDCFTCRELAVFCGDRREAGRRSNAKLIESRVRALSAWRNLRDEGP